MPMKSEAQRRWMHANKPEMAERWEKHTPKRKKLPERKKAAHDLGVLLGICQSGQPLETRLVALHKAAAASPSLMPAVAAHAAEWVLQAEQQCPGFTKDACARLEKQATNGATPAPAAPAPVAPAPAAPAPAAPAPAAPAPGSPAAMWQLGKTQLSKKPGMTGTLSKMYGFLQKNPWVLPLAGLALGGMGGGMGGILGGVGGFMAQKYLPQLAGWGMQQAAPKQWGAFSQQQQQQILKSQDPYGTARGLVTTGMGRHGTQQISSVLKDPMAALRGLLGGGQPAAAPAVAPAAAPVAMTGAR